MILTFTLKLFEMISLKNLSNREQANLLEPECDFFLKSNDIYLKFAYECLQNQVNITKFERKFT